VDVATPEFSRRMPCPPHGPIVVDASEEGYYVASCMTFKVVGPGREDTLKAKLAFDETWY
jgi:hypothetical protein